MAATHQTRTGENAGEAPYFAFAESLSATPLAATMSAAVHFWAQRARAYIDFYDELARVPELGGLIATQSRFAARMQQDYWRLGEQLMSLWRVPPADGAPTSSNGHDSARR